MFAACAVRRVRGCAGHRAGISRALAERLRTCSRDVFRASSGESMKERRAAVRPEDDRGTTRMRASGNPRAVSGTAPLQLRAFPSRRLPDHLREITRRLVGPSPTRGDCPPPASSGQTRPGGRAVVPGPSARRSSTMDVGPISDPPDRATWQCTARNAPVSGSAVVVCSNSRVSCLQMMRTS
jgi:hypothetical protein